MALGAAMSSFIQQRDTRVQQLIQQGIKSGELRDEPFFREQARCEILSGNILDHSALNFTFSSIKANQGIDTALRWYYEYCIRIGYVRAERDSLNRRWTARTEWGDIEMSINLAKPEKDPRDIAAAAKKPALATVASERGEIPPCVICRQNEGFPGLPPEHPHGPRPPRQNLRILDIDLNGEDWGLQFSPYGYFDQHCIAMSNEHRPMRIDEGCLRRLFAFVDQFPNYFIGSNADLPIVGGSILGHDHFQGGRHRFPLNDAPVDFEFEMSGHAGVKAGIARWPLTVVRLTGKDSEALVTAACHVLEVWRGYSDESACIVACTDGTLHNTITPMLTKNEDAYTLDLALRCNIATKDRPLGLFHPRPEYHYIKKENIGLIEVMGLSILPGRIKARLESGELTTSEIDRVFVGVLDDCGVFKWDDEGRKALRSFLKAL